VTLRLRLLLLLVGIVAAGLVISDVVTYNALQSFLTTRVDQQLEAAAFPVGRALLSSSGLGPQVPAAPRTFTVPPGTDPFVAPGAFRNGGRLLSPGRGPSRAVLIPSGTYGQLRNRQGTIEAHLFFAYGGKAPRAPTLPGKLPGSGLPAGHDLYFTTSSPGPASVSYRALAKPLDDGSGVIVVALPLTDLESTLRRLLGIELIVSAAVLLGLGVLSWGMVRRDLRPLESMTRTAGAIAHGDLSQRVPPMGERTEVGQLGQAFNTMLDEIETAFAQRAASEDRLRRFLADASHELRTPLTSILGYSELFDLGMQDRPADVALSLRHIRDEATRMATLVDDLFLLAQLDHERPFRFESVDLEALARRCSEALSVSTPDRPVTVVGEGPVLVEGDADRLRQVVDNLAVNAIRHTPGGAGVAIAVTDEGAWAVVTVHDDGPGIDPTDAARIFEPFYRSDPSRARSSGGAGLGLAIVAAIVEAHGGTVALVAGPGTTFEVRLPKVQGGEPVRVDAEAQGTGDAAGDRSMAGTPPEGAAEAPTASERA
jgi:two-component system OmpR family sensor kinase